LRVQEFPVVSVHLTSPFVVHRERGRVAAVSRPSRNGTLGSLIGGANPPLDVALATNSKDKSVISRALRRARVCQSVSAVLGSSCTALHCLARSTKLDAPSTRGASEPMAPCVILPPCMSRVSMGLALATTGPASKAPNCDDRHWRCYRPGILLPYDESIPQMTICFQWRGA
jgi:hypothetical protein